ncbi:MAG: acyl-CoA thioesterase [Desulfobulbaceae bacterium]|jgi:acyl-CoA thioesterase YciA|nr:acyl-CoA thioesterase [Desulfobulbaceae bacterium]
MMKPENSAETKPTGNLLLRVVPMPADANPNGDIFGGWVMSQMDVAGGILARKRARSRIVTVSVETINFIRPIHVGDIVCCYGEIVRVGKTSMTIHLEVYVSPALPPPSGEDESSLVASSAFTFVAIDEAGRPHPVDR